MEMFKKKYIMEINLHDIIFNFRTYIIEIDWCNIIFLRCAKVEKEKSKIMMSQEKGRDREEGEDKDEKKQI